MYVFSESRQKASAKIKGLLHSLRLLRVVSHVEWRLEHKVPNGGVGVAKNYARIVNLQNALFPFSRYAGPVPFANDDGIQSPKRKGYGL